MELGGNVIGNIAGSLHLEGGGDGDTVDVTPVVTSGTKIATIVINEGSPNEESVDLYAPESFSGDYNDLTNKPDLFSGSYGDLTNKPTLNGDTISGNMFTNNYSINEHIVGTWIDGKPLYEKTIEWAGSSNNNSIKIDSTIDSTMIKVRSLQGVGYMHDNINEIPLPYCNLSASQSLSIGVADGMWLYNQGINSIVKVYVTVRYTKNADHILSGVLLISV